MASLLTLLLFLSLFSENLLGFEVEYECATELSMKLPDVPFYLKLEDAVVVNDSKTVINETCQVDDVLVRDLSCMCGEKLTDRWEAIQTRLNRTCQFYNERMIKSNSPLDFCERSLTQLGKCVTFEPSQNVNVDNRAFTAESLRAKLQQIKKILDGYFSVLDRTIAHVYLPSAEHRCQCLEYYKRWLCASELTFVTSSNGSNGSIGSGETGLEPIRPCLSVCHDVLKTCPYYLPSEFQLSNDSDTPQQVIYGGYPAFDCPRRKYCGESCTYGQEGFCFGKSNGPTVRMTFSLILIMLQSLPLIYLLFL